MATKDERISISAAFSYKLCKKLDGISGAGSTAWWSSRVHKLYGVAPESLVPSNTKTDKEMLSVEIPFEAFEIARNFRAIYYQRLYTLNDFAYALNKKEDEPGGCAIEFDIFESIASAPKGEVPLPKIGEKRTGSHCVAAHKYIKKDNGQEFFFFSNSWGRNWGDNGFGYLPISYLEHDLINSGWATDVQVLPEKNPKTVVQHLKGKKDKKFRVERNWYPPLRHSQYRVAVFDIYIDQDLLVGHIHVSPMNEDTAEIEEIYILPQFQGLGLGAATLKLVEATMRSYNFKRIIGWVGAQDVVSGRRGRVLRFFKKAKYSLVEDDSRFKDAVYKFDKVL